MLVAVIVAMVVGTAILYSGSLKSFVPVTVTSDRSGLVMETGAKVMLNGVQVGRVAGVTGGRQPVELKLDIDVDQAKYIPANVAVQISATTVFGAKYVDLI
jgi:phospholipid/cholesterol/gamma-HCH transport system substrate-binding protein